MESARDYEERMSKMVKLNNLDQKQAKVADTAMNDQCDIDEKDMLDMDDIGDEEGGASHKMINSTDFTSGLNYLDDDAFDSSRHS